MNRQVIKESRGQKAIDGAGVHLVRVLGNDTTDLYDPFLMLDAFDSTNPEEYVKGFPMHPHRGIETVSFLSKGQMLHRDHLGTEATVHDGEAQWLTAGSGAKHEEMPNGERLLGTQLWLNMSARDKMTADPAYHSISKSEIKEIPLEGGLLRLITGNYKDAEGWSAFLFTLLGEVNVSDTLVREKTAAKLSDGDRVVLETGENGAEILLYSSRRLDEPVAWYGPIVMNTREELVQAFTELEEGTFINKTADYE